MIVVDASVVVELLTDLGAASRLHVRLGGESLLAPDILPIEVASGLRGLNRGGHLDDHALEMAVTDLLRFAIDLHPALPLVPRVLALRHNFSAYDASYVALAEAFHCPLLTLDRRLANAARTHCDVEVALVSTSTSYGHHPATPRESEAIASTIHSGLTASRAP